MRKTSWSKHLPVTVLYKDKLQLSDIIRKSRLKLVRNYWSSKSEILSPFSVARISAWNTEPWQTTEGLYESADGRYQPTQTNPKDFDGEQK